MHVAVDRNSDFNGAYEVVIDEPDLRGGICEKRDERPQTKDGIGIDKKDRNLPIRNSSSCWNDLYD